MFVSEPIINWSLGVIYIYLSAFSHPKPGNLQLVEVTSTTKSFSGEHVQLTVSIDSSNQQFEQQCCLRSFPFSGVCLGSPHSSPIAKGVKDLKQFWLASKQGCMGNWQLQFLDLWLFHWEMVFIWINLLIFVDTVQAQAQDSSCMGCQFRHKATYVSRDSTHGANKCNNTQMHRATRAQEAIHVPTLIT